MKTLATGLQAHLDSGATTLCWCWRITRADAQVQGFTDHDVDVNFDGTDFEAASGISASEVQSTLGLAVDNLAVMGALSSSAINEAAIAAGLYDNAEIEIWRVNWSAPDQRALMRKGTLGEIKRGALGFEAEMRGLVQGLSPRAGALAVPAMPIWAMRDAASIWPIRRSSKAEPRQALPMRASSPHPDWARLPMAGSVAASSPGQAAPMRAGRWKSSATRYRRVWSASSCGSP